MSTTIAVVSLAVIIVIFLLIKKIFQNKAVSNSIPNAGDENDVMTYKPPVEIPSLKLINEHSSYSAKSSRSNHSTRSPPKKEKKINISKQYVSEGFVSDRASYKSDNNFCKRP